MATTSLVSVAQLRELPDPTDGTYHELHGGQVVRLTIPKKRHQRLQRHLRRLLEPLAAPYGIVELEIGFRSLPEYEARRADVAFVSQARWDADEDDLMGAPEMVIEVLSPSNTVTEIDEKRSLCLAHGCREFWHSARW